MADETFAGPVNVVVFGFPASASIGEGLQRVLDRVDAGLIEILDIEYVTTDASGTAVSRPVTDLQDRADLDLSVFEGACSNVLDAEDLAAAAADLAPGGFGVAIVYEDRSLAAASTAWSRAGGTELLSGGVDVEQLAAALA